IIKADIYSLWIDLVGELKNRFIITGHFISLLIYCQVSISTISVLIIPQIRQYISIKIGFFFHHRVICVVIDGYIRIITHQVKSMIKNICLKSGGLLLGMFFFLMKLFIAGKAKQGSTSCQQTVDLFHVNYVLSVCKQVVKEWDLGVGVRSNK